MKTMPMKRLPQFLRSFLEPIPAEDGDYICYELKPVRYTCIDGKFYKEGEEPLPANYGGTD
jgi:hypothetical protein